MSITKEEVQSLVTDWVKEWLSEVKEDLQPRVEEYAKELGPQAIKYGILAMQGDQEAETTLRHIQIQATNLAAIFAQQQATRAATRLDEAVAAVLVFVKGLLTKAVV